MNELTISGAQFRDMIVAGAALLERNRQAIDALAEITGDITDDDILGSIFSKFCVGK